MIFILGNYDFFTYNLDGEPRHRRQGRRREVNHPPKGW